MVGITGLQVSHFMNNFRKLGFIDYSDNGGLKVHSGLLSVVLHDDAQRQWFCRLQTVPPHSACSHPLYL
jgi:hypothetical protein